MPVRRRRPIAKKVTKRPEATRVVKIFSDGAWESFKEKHAKQLIIVHFSGGFSEPSKHLRPLFAQYSRLPQFSHVQFAEVDVEQLSEMAAKLGIQACPTIACWRNGELLRMSGRGEGGNPAFIKLLLDQYAGDKPAQPRWRSLLSKGLMLVVALAATKMAWNMATGGEKEDPDKSLVAVDKNIKKLRMDISMAKRRKQRKLAQRLTVNLSKLEKERKKLGELVGKHGKLNPTAKSSAARPPARTPTKEETSTSPATGGKRKSSRTTNGKKKTSSSPSNGGTKKSSSSSSDGKTKKAAGSTDKKTKKSKKKSRSD
mmetsp:Transcript_3200/g.9267  ORF Transcript_3200/g.9267 Transcript_3200/m.9267 type:complete len:314 (-) Transcript_3200:1797-2738(-)